MKKKHVPIRLLSILLKYNTLISMKLKTCLNTYYTITMSLLYTLLNLYLYIRLRACSTVPKHIYEWATDSTQLKAKSTQKQYGAYVPIEVGLSPPYIVIYYFTVFFVYLLNSIYKFY